MLKPSRSKTFLAAAAAGAIGIGVCAGAAQAGQCLGSKRLGIMWFAKRATAKISLSATRCDAVPPCALTNPTAKDVVLTAPPIVVTLTDALGQSLGVNVDAKDPECGSICRQTKAGVCPGGSETHYGLGARRMRFTFGYGGMVTLLGVKMAIPSPESPNLAPPVSINVTDGNGYTLDMKVSTCIIRQKLGSYSLKCY